MDPLGRLQEEIIRCNRCPRLTQYRREVARLKVRRYADWSYWGRPLPSLGDPEARLLVVGMAPAAHGGNRTGRMFTGDRSGEWLFEALHRFGFANRADGADPDSEVVLRDCYITAVLRCAPPKNRPTAEEIRNCLPYLKQELEYLKAVKVYVALGRIAHQGLLKAMEGLRGERLKAHPFGHGRTFELDDQRILISSYHPSQQNTQTGRLTREMWNSIFRRARRILDK